MDRVLTIIPAAGRGSRMLSLTENCAKSMVPISSKPLISYLLDQLVEQGLKDVVIIVGYKKETIIDYVDICYKDLLNITYVEQTELLGLGHALYETVLQVDLTPYSGIFVMLGDAVFNTNKIYNFDKSYIACMDMPDYSRWCIAVEEDMKLKYLLDKPSEKPDRNLALVGAYYFDNVKLYRDSIIEAIKKDIKIRNEYQISTAIEIYNRKEDIQIILLENGEWLDFGEYNEYNKNRKKINQSRIFNNIKYKDDAITKSSANNKIKIQREIMWYLAMPHSLRKYFPNLIDYSLEDTSPSYTVSYCESNTVQEMWLYSNFSMESWVKIFNNIIEVIKEFKSCSNHNNINFYKFITNNIRSRVNLDEFFSGDCIINDKEYDLLSLKEFFMRSMELYKYYWSNVESYIVHGDMVFSNMMYSIVTDDIKLIDPRGDFNGNIIYGYTNYDIAKLAQCIVGDYDYIVNDLFYLSDDGYKFYLDKDDSFKESLLDLICKDYDKKEILFITAIQFMTMIPLHSEKKSHQTLMRYKAIELLDRCKKEEE